MIGSPPIQTRRGVLIPFARDVLVIVGLFIRLHISFSGPSLEFSNKDVFFQNLANTEGNVAEQVTTLLAFVVAILVMRKFRLSFNAIFRISLPFLPFLLFAFLSVAWSDYPFLTMRRSMRLSIELCTLILISMSYVNEVNRLLRIVFFVFLAVAIADIISLAAPSLSFTEIGFNGVHYHKLEAGQFILFAMPIFAIGFLNSGVSRFRLLGLLGLAICLVLFPLTRAKTAWITAPLAIAAVLICKTMRRRGAGIWLIPLLVIALVLSLATIVLADLTPSYLIEEVFGDPTLTGRDVIWRFVFDKFRDHEIFGVGYGALWQVGTDVTNRLEYLYNIYAVNQAHNGYIDILVQTGVVGFVILLLTLLVVLRRLTQAIIAAPSGILSVPLYAMFLFVCMLTLNLTDSSFFWAASYDWIFPVALYALSYGLFLGAGKTLGAAIPNQRAGLGTKRSSEAF